MLDNIETLDWSDTTRKAQENWIGRSEGAEVDFAVEGGNAVVRVFTTRPDTLFGATYMVLAPGASAGRCDHDAARNARRSIATATRSRSATSSIAKKVDKEKTGVFTGGYCINPVNGERIPIWIADYVLMDYGTGAIMAVPGHDERDFEFAQRFGLPIVRVIAGAGDSATTPLAARHMPATARWSTPAASTA